MASVSFEQYADRYDATRGGLRRGEDLAATMAARLRPGAVLEIGVGTGAVAVALARRGHPVVGVDLSPAMLRRAQARLGSRVAVADGYHLPVRSAAVPNVAVVWVLQLVPDVPGLLCEAARVLAPTGRLTVIPAGGRWDDDDVGNVLEEMGNKLRPPQDRPHQVVEVASRLGLRVVAHDATAPFTTEESPETAATSIERRVWSSLWDLPEPVWDAVVAPAIAALRALPEPTRPRRRVSRHDVVVLEWD